MWKGINISEVPIRVFQFGRETIIPYDGKVIIFEDDSVFDEYKSFFRIIESPIVKPVINKDAMFNDFILEAEKKGLLKPLKGSGINVNKLKKRFKKYGGVAGKKLFDGKTRKPRRKNYIWKFVSPEGIVYDDPSLLQMGAMIGCDRQNFYKYVNKNKYKGWTITKTDINDSKKTKKEE
jgi:hypothetical protein